MDESWVFGEFDLISGERGVMCMQYHLWHDNEKRTWHWITPRDGEPPVVTELLKLKKQFREERTGILKRYQAKVRLLMEEVD